MDFVWRPGSLLSCLLGLIGSLACGCSSDEGSECRATSECRAELECAGPDAAQACGIPAMEQCSSDADCGLDGTVCHAVPDACSPDGVGSECRPPCSEGGCGEGFVCDLDRAACVAIACDQGWACESYEACEPAVDPSAPVHARTHGCVAIACSGDELCPSGGACVNGVCQSGPGVCVSPEAVP